MKSYNHFTLFEREFLQKSLEFGKSFRNIAKSLGRSPSSISREVKRNWSKKKKRYHPWRAQVAYMVRRKNCHRKYVLFKNNDILEFTLKGLKQFWSPEVIAGRWNKEHDVKLGFRSIYRAVRKNLLPGIDPKTHFRRRGKRTVNQVKSYTTYFEPSIHQRPRIVEERGRIGDFEGDTVYGSVGKGYLVTAIDRKSRYLIAAIAEDKSIEKTNKAFEEAFKTLPKETPIKTMTLDNGSEFVGFREIEKRVGIEIYFADTHSPWQRGSNENINGVLRFFFPKGTNFKEVTTQQLHEVVELINNRPRKCLDFLSPKEFLLKCCT